MKKKDPTSKSGSVNSRIAFEVFENPPPLQVSLSSIRQGWESFQVLSFLPSDPDSEGDGYQPCQVWLCCGWGGCRCRCVKNPDMYNLVGLFFKPDMYNVIILQNIDVNKCLYFYTQVFSFFN